MKKNRRDFLKLTGLSGISLVGASMMPGYAATQNKDKQPALSNEPAHKSSPEMPTEPLEPAPEWLQNADMITTAPWFKTLDKSDIQNKIWNGYDIEFEDVWVEKYVRLAADNGLKKIHEQIPIIKDGIFDGSSIKGVPLISHVPISETAFKQAHKQGFRVIPYVHFTDIHTFYADQDIFPFQHPEVLLRDKEGKWVHIPMDGTDRFNRFLICANNPVYCKLSLAYIKKIMDWGADGLFVDNVGHRKECFAPNFTKKNPEFPPYIHEHIYPENTHDYAWDRFLESVYKLVKSYGKDKIVVLNSGIDTEFQKNGDCCMWESFIYSWAWEGRRPEDSWDNINKRAAENEWYTKSGRRITALSTINPLRQKARDDAFWAFSAARLLDFIWWAELDGTGAEMLYRVHLGKASGPLNDENGLSFRIYENGIIVLNDSTDDKNLEIALPGSFHQSQLLDLYNDSKKIPVKNGKVKVSIPKDCARVYITSSKKD
jgi:hypothetical protein